MNKLNQTWQLEMFPGGSGSASFRQLLSEIEEKTSIFGKQLGGEGEDADSKRWAERIARIQWLRAALVEAESFIGCLEAQDVNDQAARVLSSRWKRLNAEFATVSNTLDQQLLAMNDDSWASLLALEEIKPVAFALGERRALAKEKLPPEQEEVINVLAIDGYHAWGDHYSTVVGRFDLTDTDGDEAKHYSVGQAVNKLHDPDRQVRSKIFLLWEQEWNKHAELCAAALNHLAGFRLSVYDKRGWSSVLKEPLAMNRMSEQTLTVMWDVIKANKQPFVAYLRRKAKLLGVDRLDWHDVEAPIGGASGDVSYDDAAAMITKQFDTFSPELAEFAKMAFEAGWIEVEDRPGKRPGGFCTSFPLSNETRIFMTYGGTASNVATLAHELGHAYHQHVMTDLPMFAQDYAMNVAETASTFAELIVSDAAVRSAKNDQERIALLEEKVQSAVSFYMNIHARFLFETAFYERRRQGTLTVEELNELMEQAQREAFCDELGQYHPTFWASKLHFYLTDVPFYNFPYTFGYLFSAGLYALAEQQGTAFASNYVALLRDTASMTVEELAMKHLNVDLTKPDFWQAAVQKTVEDAELFLQLTE